MLKLFEPSIIIIQFNALGRFLISYISAWQTVLNRQGSPEFEFNTYIISVLVIFFLQVNYKIPTLDNIANFVSNANTNVPNFKTCPRQFFDFYGNRYQMHNHVISAHIGQWQEMRCHPEQTRFSEAKQRYSWPDFEFMFGNIFNNVFHNCAFQIAKWNWNFSRKLDQLHHVRSRFGSTQYKHNSRNTTTICQKLSKNVSNIRKDWMNRLNKNEVVCINSIVQNCNEKHFLN